MRKAGTRGTAFAARSWSISIESLAMRMQIFVAAAALSLLAGCYGHREHERSAEGSTARQDEDSRAIPREYERCRDLRGDARDECNREEDRNARERPDREPQGRY